MKEDEEIFFERNNIAKKVLLELSEKNWRAMPLSKKMNIHRESVSRAFKTLKDRGYVECKTPGKPNYRIYKITRIGKNKPKSL